MLLKTGEKQARAISKAKESDLNINKTQELLKQVGKYSFAFGKNHNTYWVTFEI